MTVFSQFHDKTAFIIVEPGLKGTENQCRALAERLEIGKIRTHYVEMNNPWRWAAPWLRWNIDKAYKNSDELFKPPSPDIIITSGRKSVLAALHMKKLSHGGSFLIQIQNPRLPPRFFDLVIAPRHDQLQGENVISTLGALHRITPEFLQEHRSPIYEELKKQHRPRIAVLVGGSTTKTNFTTDKADSLADSLEALKQNTGASLMITTSRRTGRPQTRLLKKRLETPTDHLWDGQGSNPYFDYLDLADAIVVTNDSVSMATEALATGKPVYIADIGRQGTRIESFHAMLAREGYTKPLPERLEDWQRPESNDMIQVCEQVAQHYNRFIEG